MSTLRRLVLHAARPSVRWRLLCAFPFAVTLGCASAVKQVATHQNSYDFREARYEEACVGSAQRPGPTGTTFIPPAECAQTVLELRAYEKHLHEAARAVKLGGAFPLQLAALKADAKKLAKRAVTK